MIYQIVFKISDKLLYFSFNYINYLDEQNFNVEPIKISKSIIIKTDNFLKIYEYTSELYYYHNFVLFPHSKVYNDHSLNFDCNTKKKYLIHNKFMDEPLKINELDNKKVYNFYNEQINTESFYNITANEECIARFYKCTFDASTIIPETATHLIFEFCDIKFNNLPLHITEIWLIGTSAIENLPICLNKLIIYGENCDLEKLKIPFGSVVEKY